MPFQPGQQPIEVGLAIRAWNMMGGIDWAGIGTVSDLLGIDDIEVLVEQLMALRDHMEQKDGR